MSVWSGAASYDAYIGRWSRLVAADFVAWLGRPSGARWLDVGCGTGALAEAVLSATAPARVMGIDASRDFVAHAAVVVPDPRAAFGVGDARALPVGDGSVDVAASGLMLNFVSDRAAVLGEMARAVRRGGVVAAYVWDYPDGMQMVRAYWDAATDLGLADPTAHEAVRFGFCRPEPLRAMLTAAGLADVDATELVVPTPFRDFEDFWTPFLGGAGPAPGHLTSLPSDQQARVRDTVRAGLPESEDGSIRLTARAWAVRGEVR